MKAGSFRMWWRLGHSGCGRDWVIQDVDGGWVIQDVVETGSFRMW